MTVTLSIGAVASAFPRYRAGVVVAADLVIPPERPPALDALIREREEAARARWAGMELSAIPGVAAWREAYKAFGIKQTRYRSSVERLVKNVLAGRELPRVNGFVDLYNAVSLAHVLPLGADDLDRVTPPFAFRYAVDGDTFVDMADAANGEGEAGASPPKPGEVVFADAEKVLCRRWNWRQDARSLIRPETTRVIVTVQGNGAGDVEAAVADLRDLIAAFCGGGTQAAVAEANAMSITV
jgi:DNA/RNA-binding domain of Phe-tRNA-synthetase-like protein